MQLTFNTGELSPKDLEILAVLVSGSATTAAAPVTAQVIQESKPKATPAKSDKVKPSEPVADPTSGPTLQDAVAAATALVSAGNAAKVKAALAEVGAKRVSELDEDAIAAFLSALDA